MRLYSVAAVSLTVLLRSDEPSFVARSAAVRHSATPRETQLREVQCHSSAVPQHSVDVQIHVIVDATCGTRHRNVLLLVVRYVFALPMGSQLCVTSVALFCD